MGYQKTIHVFCLWPWNKIKISADGAVRNCCFQSQFVCDIKDLKQEWENGKYFQQIRECTAKGEIEPSTCLPLKNCPHIGRNRKLKTKPIYPETTHPSLIELDLPNTTCNVGGPIPTPENPACIMCPRSCEHFVPDGQRFEEVLQLTRPWISRCRELWLAGLGESFWQDQYLGILDKLDYFRYKKYCRYVTFTNGTLFGQRNRDKILEFPNSKMIFSLDAGTAETYKKIRRLDAFDTVVDNIRAYARDPRRNHKSQLIFISYNINLINIIEVEKMVSLWRGEAINGLGFNPTYISGAAGLTDIIANETNYKLFQEASRRINRIASKLNMPHVDVVSPLESYFGKRD